MSEENSGHHLNKLVLSLPAAVRQEEKRSSMQAVPEVVPQVMWKQCLVFKSKPPFTCSSALVYVLFQYVLLCSIVLTTNCIPISSTIQQLFFHSLVITVCSTTTQSIN